MTFTLRSQPRITKVVVHVDASTVEMVEYNIIVEGWKILVTIFYYRIKLFAFMLEKVLIH